MEKQKYSILIFKKGFNYSQDGPGNRLVYHLAGCNMRCPWCSNPEGMDTGDSSLYTVVSVDEIYNEILGAKRLYFDNGGVTFTGGEATLQLNALKELFERLKPENIDITIETNGSSKRLPELFPYMRFIMMDFKHYDNKAHQAATGLGNDIVKENIKKAGEAGLEVVIRIPLINNYNANLSDIPGFLNFIKLINGPNIKVELLKYHEYGRDKWNRLKRSYKIVNGFVDDEIYETFINVFQKNGINIIKT